MARQGDLDLSLTGLKVANAMRQLADALGKTIDCAPDMTQMLENEAFCFFGHSESI